MARTLPSYIGYGYARCFFLTDIHRIDERYTSFTPETADFTVDVDGEFSFDAIGELAWADRLAWDGYQAERKQILEYVYDNQIDNVAVFTVSQD